MFDKDGYSILMQSIQSSRSLSRLERGRGREVNFCTLRISSFVRLFTVALLVAVVGLPQQQRHPLLQILFLPPLFFTPQSRSSTRPFFSVLGWAWTSLAPCSRVSL
jgi:hypothetical protein